MPTSYQVKLPPPADWQELQRMTCDLYRRLWSDDDLQQFGTLGQRQDGVDLFGFMNKTQEIGGVQCKCAEELTASEVEHEYEKSLKFSPKLSKYVIVTTTKRDTAAQRKAAELSIPGPHRCTIMFWEDFCEKLSEYKDVLRKFYSDFILYDLEGDSAGKLIEVNIDVNRYEILVSRMPPEHAHYSGTVLISDLLTSKCIPCRLPVDWTKLEGVVGMTRADAFLVATWLNSFDDVGELLRLGQTTLTYELTPEEQMEAEQQGFHLLRQE
jgi:hypothetical protein